MFIAKLPIPTPFQACVRFRPSVELPLFVFNPAGISLKLNDKDWLLFGFKGKWEKVLLEQNWQRQPLVKEGLDIDLFTHPTIKQKLVIARNVYGDDANIIVDTFYKKGVRQVVYLGTAGAIANYQVGDVVTPSEFIDNNNVSVPFQKNLAHGYRTELSQQVTVHDQTKHGRVPTIYHETLALLDNWQVKIDRGTGCGRVVSWRSLPKTIAISKWRRCLPCLTRLWVAAPSTNPKLDSTSSMNL